jgi:hypothetical protein
MPLDELPPMATDPREPMPPVRGTIIARLQDCHPDRIVVGKETTLYLADGVTCPYARGIMLEIAYTIRGNRYEIESIRPAPPERQAP